MIKLIGKDIVGQNIILECDDVAAVRRAKRMYAKVGVHLESYNKAIEREAKRLMENPPSEPPRYRF